jgi:hypothetical protein
MNVSDLGCYSQILLANLISARLAWQSPSELAAAAGFRLEYTQELLAELDAAGWIEAWEYEDGPEVTLTPIAATLLGVHLVEYGPDELPRWARDGSDDPPMPRAKGIFAKYSSLALIPDPHPGPLEQLAAAEEAAWGPSPVEAILPDLLAMDQQLDPAAEKAEAAREKRRRREAARRAARRAEKSRLKRLQLRAKLRRTG